MSHPKPRMTVVNWTFRFAFASLAILCALSERENPPYLQLIITYAYFEGVAWIFRQAFKGV